MDGEGPGVMFIMRQYLLPLLRRIVGAGVHIESVWDDEADFGVDIRTPERT